MREISDLTNHISVKINENETCIYFWVSEIYVYNSEFWISIYPIKRCKVYIILEKNGVINGSNVFNIRILVIVLYFNSLLSNIIYGFLLPNSHLHSDIWNSTCLKQILQITCISSKNAFALTFEIFFMDCHLVHKTLKFSTNVHSPFLSTSVTKFLWLLLPKIFIYLISCC